MNSTNVFSQLYSDIERLVRTLIDSAKFNKSFRATVTEKINNTVYKVSYKNIDYKVKSYYNLGVGDVVWVCAPKNDWDSLFVQSYSGFQDRVITTDNIVNNYTTNVPGTVLDGRMGKTMKTEIDGIKTSLTTLNINLGLKADKVDLNNVSKRYFINFGVIAANSSVTKTVIFGTPAINTGYSVFVTTTTAVAYWGNIVYTVTDKTTDGFKITAFNTGGFATGGDIFIDWGIIRTTG